MPPHFGSVLESQDTLTWLQQASGRHGILSEAPKLLPIWVRAGTHALPTELRGTGIGCIFSDRSTQEWEVAASALLRVPPFRLRPVEKAPMYGPSQTYNQWRNVMRIVIVVFALCAVGCGPMSGNMLPTLPAPVPAELPSPAPPTLDATHGKWPCKTGRVCAYGGQNGSEETRRD